MVPLGLLAQLALNQAAGNELKAAQRRLQEEAARVVASMPAGNVIGALATMAYARQVTFRLGGVDVTVHTAGVRVVIRF